MTIEYRGDLWTIGRWVSGFYNNAYLVTCNSTNKSVIIDTPDKPDELIAAAAETDVQAILITHNHWDHLEGFDVVTDRFKTPVGIGANDAHAVADRDGYRDPIDVSQNNILQVGDITIRCIETPGTPPALPATSCQATIPAPRPTFLPAIPCSPGGPGRTSDPDALNQIIASITSRLHNLPANTVVMPGHGDFTTIEQSVEEYAVFAAKPRDPGLFGDVAWQ